jgi:hypothetical protein
MINRKTVFRSIDSSGIGVISGILLSLNFLSGNANPNPPFLVMKFGFAAGHTIYQK